MKTRIIAGMALVVGFPAHGQDRAETPQNGGDIIVTAQRRAEKLQDVPVAVSALSGKDIRSANVKEVRDLQNIVPGLAFRSSLAATSADIFIRGVGTSDFNSNTVGAVGVYVDDVYVGANAAKLFNVFDSAGIEVLRGPQGTLYGRNTTAGAIKFASHLPDAESTGDFSLQYGRFNDVRAEAALGGPVATDTLKFRISGFFERNDGTTRNRLTGHRVNNIDMGAGRLILDWTPGDDWLFRLSIHGGENRGGARQFTHRGYGPDGTDLLGYADNDDDPWAGAYNVEGEEKINDVGTSLKIERDFGSVGLSSITAFETVTHHTLEDTDASPNSLMTGRYVDKDREVSQEVRLHSNSTGSWNWSVGGYYFHDRLLSDGSFDLLRDLRDPAAPDDGFDPANAIGLLRSPFRQVTNSEAVFAQVDRRLTDALKLTGGIRYTHDHIAFDYDGFFDDENGLHVPVATTDQGKSWSNVSYRAAVDWKALPSTLVYASISSGYNSGGWSGGAATDQSQLDPFRPEKLTAYEAGVKTDLLRHALRINLAGFYYDYRNLQVFTIDNSGAVPIERKTNAGNARVYGMEAEITAHLTHEIALFINGSLLHARYRDFVDAGGDYSGNQLTDAPKFSGSVGLSYTHDFDRMGTVDARIDQTYQSRIYFTPANESEYSQKRYGLTNARVALTLPGNRWTVAVYGKNIFQRRYLMDITPLISFDQLNYGDPATYGAQLSFHF